MSVRGGTTVVRIVAAALLLPLLYFVGGQLVRGWVELHLDAWENRSGRDPAQVEAEWLRVVPVLDAARRGWPWMTSLHIQGARTSLIGGWRGFIAPADAGEAALVQLAVVRGQAAESGYRLMLEAQAGILLRDWAAVEETCDLLAQVAPTEGYYWGALVQPLAEHAQYEPHARAILGPVMARYAREFPSLLRALAHRDPVVRAFLPPDFPLRPPAATPVTAAPATPAR